MIDLDKIKSVLQDQLEESDDSNTKQYCLGFVSGLNECDQITFKQQDELETWIHQYTRNRDEESISSVGGLISHLVALGRDRSLIVDDDGNTYPLSAKSIALWNENDPESPVAIYVNSFVL